jgi:hypothetical protein
MTPSLGSRTLASAAVGEQLTLTAFPFRALRALFGDLGLGTGSIVRCLVTAPRVMLVEREDGQQVRLDGEWAQHVQVEPVSDSAAGTVK